MKKLFKSFAIALVALAAYSGVVQAATVLTVPQGGTGLGTVQTGRVPFGRGTSSLGTDSQFVYEIVSDKPSLTVRGSEASLQVQMNSGNLDDLTATGTYSGDPVGVISVAQAGDTQASYTGSGGFSPAEDVEGSISGATGKIRFDLDEIGINTLFIYDVVGTFQVGDVLIGLGDGTLTSVSVTTADSIVYTDDESTYTLGQMSTSPQEIYPDLFVQWGADSGHDQFSQWQITSQISYIGRVVSNIFNGQYFNIFEEPGAGTDAISLFAPSISSPYSLRFPSSGSPGNGYVLEANSLGQFSWASNDAIPGGADTNVQFNNGGVLGGSDNFVWFDAAKDFAVGDLLNTAGYGKLTVKGSTGSSRIGGTLLEVAQEPSGIITAEFNMIPGTERITLGDPSGSLDGSYWQIDNANHTITSLLNGTLGTQVKMFQDDNRLRFDYEDGAKKSFALFNSSALQLQALDSGNSTYGELYLDKNGAASITGVNSNGTGQGAFGGTSNDITWVNNATDIQTAISMNATNIKAEYTNTTNSEVSDMTLDGVSFEGSYTGPATESSVRADSGQARLQWQNPGASATATASAENGVAQVRYDQGLDSSYGQATNGAFEVFAADGTNVALQKYNGDGTTTSAGRVWGTKGADVATASSITLGLDGTYFGLTGTTTVNCIDGDGWQNGQTIILKSSANVTMDTDNGSCTGTFLPMFLAGTVDFAMNSDDTLSLVKDGSVWVEWARMER